MPRQSGLCEHARKGFGRVISRDGREQVVEKCETCGANTRGPGVWVSGMELFRLGIRRDDLPVFKDLRTPEDRGEQATLFGG